MNQSRASRQHPRATVEMPLELRSEYLPATFDHRCKNLSVGGMMIAGEHPIDRGTKLMVRLGFSATEQYEIRARVVWTETALREAVMGLAFMETNPELVAAVTALITTQRIARS